jgi:hypothetical protein
MQNQDKHTEDITEIKTKINTIIKNTTEPFYKKVIFWLLVFLAISGISVFTLLQFFKVETIDDHGSGFPPEMSYKMYLSSELTRPHLNAETMILVNTEFEATEVVIVGTSPTGEIDRLDMQQSDRLTWNKKVRFVEVGLWTVTATAKTLDGDEIVEYMVIEVINILDELFN